MLIAPQLICSLTRYMLPPGFLGVRFELRGRRTVEELVECVEPVFAAGD